jgi:hypothetical protein
MKRSPTVAVTALTVISLLLGACSVSTDFSADRSADSPNTTELAPFDPSGSKGNRTAPADAFTDEDMAQLLVTIGDLPTGWATDDSPATDNPRDTQPSCLSAADAIAGDAPSASVSFTSTDTGEFFYESLANIATGAEGTFNQLVDTLDGCTDVSFTTNGQDIVGTMEPISFYEYGDDSAAWRMRFPLRGETLDYELVAVRYDHIIAVYAFAGASPVDEDTFDELILTAEDVLFGALDPNADPGTDPGTGPTDPGSPGADPGGSGDTQTA